MCYHLPTPSLVLTDGDVLPAVAILVLRGRQLRRVAGVLRRSSGEAALAAYARAMPCPVRPTPCPVLTSWRLLLLDLCPMRYCPYTLGRVWYQARDAMSGPGTNAADGGTRESKQLLVSDLVHAWRQLAKARYLASYLTYRAIGT